MENIKLKIKLSAYTKGVIPDVSNFITDVEDEKTYVRTHGEWLELSEIVKDETIELDQNSGLDLRPGEDKISYLSIRQTIIKENDLSDELEDDMTYYVIEDERPKLYINGGTAYSDENQEYKIKVTGGNAFTTNFDLKLIPVNSKGVK